jgi:hypothetical protein
LEKPEPLADGLNWMRLSTTAIVVGVAKFPNAAGGALELQVCLEGDHSFLSNNVL